MKALVKTAPGPDNMEILDRPKPKCGPSEVLLEVNVASICGSDLHIYLGDVACKENTVMGHEFVGTIAEKADDVNDWQIGQRVVSELHAGACGKCKYCKKGIIMMCPNKKALGWASDGAFAEYIKVPSNLLHAIPDHICDNIASLVEPCACALGVMEELTVGKDDFVVVLGDGFMGLSAALNAKALGAKEVVLVGQSRFGTERLAMADKLSLTRVLDSEKDDIEQEIMNMTDGLGADMVVEASGVRSCLDIAFNAVAKKGNIFAIGLTGKSNITVPWDKLMEKRVKIGFTWSSDSAGFNKVISLMADGLIKFPSEMVKKYSLDQWRQAFEDLKSRKALKAQFIIKEK